MDRILENVLLGLSVSAFPDRAALGAALPLVTGVKFGAAMAMIGSIVLVALRWVGGRLLGGGGAEGSE
jgi:hypothetical protein